MSKKIKFFSNMLYLYMDGVTEAMDKDEEQYGEDRLKKLLSFGETPARSTLALAYRRDRYQSEVERAMIDVIREALR